MTEDPYAVLAELAERELALVREGRVEEVAELQARRAELVAVLPARPPASARPALERALAVQELTSAALAEAAQAVAAELERIGHGRRAARGYAAAAPPSAGVVDHAA